MAPTSSTRLMQLNNTVSQRQMVELPLNGRNPLTLVSCRPALHQTAPRRPISTASVRPTNITRDGISVGHLHSRECGYFLHDRPNVDDTGEFTIITQNMARGMVLARHRATTGDAAWIERSQPRLFSIARRTSHAPLTISRRCRGRS